MNPPPSAAAGIAAALAVIASLDGAAAQTRCTDALPCIQVTDTVYGPPGGSSRTCAPTSTLRAACDRRLTCEIAVGNGLCGDPAPGVTKQLFVEWTCTGQASTRFDVVREGGIMTLGCGL